MTKTPRQKPFIFSRGLPPTGQSVIYQAGDDGDYQKCIGYGDTASQLDTDLRLVHVLYVVGDDDRNDDPQRFPYDLALRCDQP